LENFSGEDASRCPGIETFSSALNVDMPNYTFTVSEFLGGNNGMEVMYKLLTSTNYEWTKSAKLLSALENPLMRLCARCL
jgi:hypothetical protein